MDKYCMIQKGNINMKKYLSLLLALCLALSLNACGGSKEEPAKAEEPAKTEESVPETQKPVAKLVEITVFAAVLKQVNTLACFEAAVVSPMV